MPSHSIPELHLIMASIIRHCLQTLSQIPSCLILIYNEQRIIARTVGHQSVVRPIGIIRGQTVRRIRIDRNNKGSSASFTPASARLLVSLAALISAASGKHGNCHRCCKKRSQNLLFHFHFLLAQ